MARVSFALVLLSCLAACNALSEPTPIQAATRVEAAAPPSPEPQPAPDAEP